MKNVDIFVCRTKQSIEECVAPSFKPGSECFPSRKCRVHFSVDSGLLVVKRWDSKLRGSAMKLSEHAANARCRVGKQYTLEVMTATGWRAGEAWRERRSSCLLSALYYSSARSLVISGMLAFRLTVSACVGTGTAGRVEAFKGARPRSVAITRKWTDSSRGPAAAIGCSGRCWDRLELADSFPHLPAVSQGPTQACQR